MRRALLAGLAASLVVVGGCRDSDDLSFCDAYVAYNDVLGSITVASASSSPASAVLGATEQVHEQVRQLQATADGRFTDPLRDLAESLEDLEATMAGVPADAGFETWLPLVEDTLEEASDDALRLRDQVGEQCTAG